MAQSTGHSAQEEKIRSKTLVRPFMLHVTLFLVPCVLCLLPIGCASLADRLCLQGHCYTVEIVRTPEARQQGLMGHAPLKADEGMFFVFDEPGVYPFWMKNMTFSIDILWLDEKKSIVHIEKNVPPCKNDPCLVYDPKVEARYVLEIPAGDVDKKKLSK